MAGIILERPEVNMVQTHWLVAHRSGIKRGQGRGILERVLWHLYIIDKDDN